MNFAYDENQNEIKELGSKILSELADDERQKVVDNSGVRFDAELWQQLGESGLLGIAIDTAYGGMGFDFESLSLLIEEAGRHVAAVPVIPTLVSAALPLQRYGDDAVKKQWLPNIASGKTIITAALAENIRLTAETNGDGGFNLSGVAGCVPYAAYADAILVVAQSNNGNVLLLADTKSATLQAQQSTACEPWSEVHFNNQSISADSIICSGKDADAALRWARQLTIAAQCVMATGLCDKMLRLTAAYTSQREQFGRAIATFQAVGQRAADGFIDIECLKLCAREAVSLLSQASADDAITSQTTQEALIIAKIWCGDVCHRLSQSSQHLHGGIGVDRDYPLHRYCLWAKQLELSLGSSARALEQLGEQIAAEYA